MSGGSYDYTYSRVEEQYVGRMYDIELDDMMKDLVQVLYGLEWWQSSDWSEDQYRKVANKFKAKWFGDRNENLERLVKEECKQLEERILKTIAP